MYTLCSVRYANNSTTHEALNAQLEGVWKRQDGGAEDAIPRPPKEEFPPIRGYLNELRDAEPSTMSTGLGSPLKANRKTAPVCWMCACECKLMSGTLAHSA
jgi:hypothetical protein